MRRLLLLLVCLVVGGSAFAQTDTVQIGTGTVTNGTTSYPSPYGHFYEGAKHHMIVRASEWAGATGTAGFITGLAFDVTSIPAASGFGINNLEFKLASVSDSDVNNGFITNAAFTSVHTNPAYVPSTIGWDYVQFSTPFFYDGVNNLLVEVCFTDANLQYTTNVIFNQTTTPFNSTVYFRNDNNATLCTATPAFETIVTQRPNMRFVVNPPTGTDAMAISLSSPTASVGAGQSYPVGINLINAGGTTITSATFGYSLNGGTPVFESFNGTWNSVQPLNFTFTTPVTMPFTGNPSLAVWVENVNGAGPDNNPGNDTVFRNYCLALQAGTYSVGGVGADYPTLDSAARALDCGITGAVVFNINPGVYHESIRVNAVLGADSANTVTWQSVTGNRYDVVVLGDNQGNPAVELNQASWQVFQNMRIMRDTTIYPNFNQAYTVRLTNANNNMFHHVDLGDDSTQVGISNFFNGFFTATGSNGNMLDSVTATSNYNGFEFDGGTRNSMTNSTMVHAGSNYPFDINNSTKFTFTGNDFSVSPTATSFPFYMIFLNGAGGIDFTGNNIHGKVGSYGMYIFDLDGSQGMARFHNNMLAFENQNSFSQYGIYFFPDGFDGDRDSVQFANNSVYVNAGGNGSYSGAFWVYGDSTEVRGSVYNNIFTIANNGVSAANFTPSNGYDSSAYDSKFNNLYNFSDSALVFDDNNFVTYYNLSDVYTNLGIDSGSVSGDPIFSGPFDLHANSAVSNNVAMPLAAIMVDIDGDVRDPLTPDIGADEFTPLADNVAGGNVPMASGCVTSLSDSIRIKITNLGTNAQTSIPVYYEISGGAIIAETWVGNLASGQATFYTFSTLGVLNQGLNTITVWTGLGADQNINNDSASQTINLYIPTIEAWGYTYGFEDSLLSTSWCTTNGAQSSVFVSGAQSGSYNYNPTFQTQSLRQDGDQNNPYSFQTSATPNGVWGLNPAREVSATVRVNNPGTIIKPRLRFHLRQYSISSFYHNFTNFRVVINGVPMIAQGQPAATIQPTSTTFPTYYQDRWLVYELDSFPAGILSVEFQGSLGGAIIQYPGNGNSIDSIRFFSDPTPVIMSVNDIADSCTVMAKTVNATVDFSNAAASVTAYYIHGANPQASVTLTGVGQNYTGTIPAGVAGQLTSYFVVATDAQGLADTSATFTYTDDYLTILSLTHSPNDTLTAVGQCDTVEILGNGGVLISEVIQFNGGGGTQGSFPSYVTSGSDMVELTGGPGANLTGWSLEIYGGSGGSTTLTQTKTFGAGAVVPANGIVVVVGGNGTDVPLQGGYFFNTGSSDYTCSSCQTGYVLKDASGVIKDAFASNGFIFAAASGVTAADFSGSTPNNGGNVGFQLNGPDNDLASDWITSDFSTTSTIGAINANVTAPTGGNFTWFSLPGMTQIGTGTSQVLCPAVTTDYMVVMSDGVCTKDTTFTITVQTVVVPDTPFNAAAVLLITPTASGNVGFIGNVVVSVQNRGSQLIQAGAMNVVFTLDAITRTESLTSLLAPGAITTVTFNNVNYSPVTTHSANLCFWTVLAGDMDLSDDTLCTQMNLVAGLDELGAAGISTSVYPVPANDAVNFQVTSATAARLELSIIDGLGRVIERRSLNVAGQSNERFNVANLASGLYRYELTDGTKRSTGQFSVAH